MPSRIRITPAHGSSAKRGRTLRTALLVAVAGATLAACGAVPDPPREAKTEGWVRAPEPPLAPRRGAAVASGGGDVFIVGGYTAEAGAVIFRDDAALYDGAQAVWRHIPLPAQRVTFPSTIKTGDQWVVTATLCSEQERDDPNCDRAGDFFARYDPAGNEWTSFADPPVPVSALKPIAWTGEELIFVASVTDGDRTLIAHEPAKDQWRELPSGHISGATALCVRDFSLVVMTNAFKTPDGNELPADPMADPEYNGAPAESVNPRIAQFDVSTGAWSDLGPPHPTLVSGTEFSLACTDTNAVVIAETNAAVYDFDSRGWTPPTNPDANGTGPLSLYTNEQFSIGNRVFLWGDRGGVVLDTSTTRWREFPAGPPSAATTVVSGAAFVYVEEPEERWGNAPRAFWYTPGDDFSSEQRLPIRGAAS